MKRATSVALSIAFSVGIFTVTGLAQDPIPRTISGGVLNGKATSLPKPTYPAAAQGEGASGAVTVQVLIDENGDVISASAVSGHPLLREVAVSAARSAKFSPTKLQGSPVKVSGFITYNFVTSLRLARLAFVLSNAETTGFFGGYSSPESIAYQLPEDWIREKEILRSLTFKKAPVGELKPEKPQPPKKGSEGSVVDPPRDNNRFTIKGDTNISVATAATYGPQKLDAKSMSSLRELSGLVETTRAALNEKSEWAFELGRSLGAVVGDIVDKSKFQSNVSKLESLSTRPPAAINENSLNQVKEFIESCKKENLSDDNQNYIVMKAEMLTNLRY
ncbi:MAG: energy transducer TonB [Pyrinomonadaceae bacterium]